MARTWGAGQADHISFSVVSFLLAQPSIALLAICFVSAEGCAISLLSRDPGHILVTVVTSSTTRAFDSLPSNPEPG